jgi:hypothetical protein
MRHSSASACLSQASWRPSASAILSSSRGPTWRSGAGPFRWLVGLSRRAACSWPWGCMRGRHQGSSTGLACGCPSTAWRSRARPGLDQAVFSPAPGSRAANVHVRVQGRPNQRYALLFRDYLRAHPVAARAYAELKRRLAALNIDVGVYADVKDPACDIIMAAAEDWCVQTGWTAGPSDA